MREFVTQDTKTQQMPIVHINQCRYGADEFFKKVLVLGCDN